MAIKKPLVLGSDGRPQQLQSGDSIDSVETGQLTVVADDTLIAGSPVYGSAAGHVDKARANASGTSRVLGLTREGIASAASGQIQCNGFMELSTAEWDAAFGTSGGLTVDTTYYLSAATAGLGTATCPSSVGQLVIILGVAVSTEILRLQISEPILL